MSHRNYSLDLLEDIPVRGYRFSTLFITFKNRRGEKDRRRSEAGMRRRGGESKEGGEERRVGGEGRRRGGEVERRGGDMGSVWERWR